MNVSRKTKQLSTAGSVLLAQLKHGKQIATSVSSLGCRRTINNLVTNGLAVLRENKNHATLSITPAGIARLDVVIEHYRKHERAGR